MPVAVDRLLLDVGEVLVVARLGLREDALVQLRGGDALVQQSLDPRLGHSEAHGSALPGVESGRLVSLAGVAFRGVALGGGVGYGEVRRSCGDSTRCVRMSPLRLQA